MKLARLKQNEGPYRQGQLVVTAALIPSADADLDETCYLDPKRYAQLEALGRLEVEVPLFEREPSPPPPPLPEGASSAVLAEIDTEFHPLISAPVS